MMRTVGMSKLLRLDVFIGTNTKIDGEREYIDLCVSIIKT